MYKKVVGTLILASALSIGLGSIDSEASQWNHTTIHQEQTDTGWGKMAEWETKKIDDHRSEFNGPAGAVQGQSVFVKGFQLQSGKSNGSASAAQSLETMIDVGDQLTNGTIEQQQTIHGTHTVVQKTSTSGSAYLLQTQSNTAATFHFQGSIKNGPSIQNQISQIHSYQFSSAVSN